MRTLVTLMAWVLCLSAHGASRQEETPPELLAQQIAIERADVIQAPIQGVIEFLNDKAQQKLPAGRSLRVIYVAPKSPSLTRMTFLFTGVSLLDVLKVAAGMAGLEISASGDAIFVHCLGEPPVRVVPVRSVALEWSSQATTALNGLTEANAESNGIINAGAALGLFPTQPPGGDSSFAPLQPEIDRSEKRRGEFNRLLQNFLSSKAKQ